MPPLPKNPFPFMWYFLRQRKGAVFFYCFLAFCAGFWGPFNSLILKKTIDVLSLGQPDDFSDLLFYIILLVGNFILFDNVTWRSITYLRARHTPVVVNQIIGRLMDHVLGHSQGFFQNTLSGKIARQISNLADGVEKIITTVAANFLRGLCLIITGFFISYGVHPVFCGVMVAWFVIFVTLSLFMSKKFVILANKQSQRESEVIGALVDVLTNQSTIRLFATQDHEYRRIQPGFENQRAAYEKSYIYALVMQAIQGGLIAVMMGFSGYFLLRLHGQGVVSPGDFALIFGLTMETGHLMWFTMSEVDEFNKALGRCRQTLGELMTPMDIKDVPGAKALECRRGEIHIKNMHFHHEASAPLFEDLCLHIRSGEKVGLVGYSGGGKSTFVHLLLRFYDIQRGVISIDDQDISKVTQGSLRQHIAMIPQDPTLFHRSLLENIRYGFPHATLEDVKNAATSAQAHDFITRLPKGYETLVGERGIKLSGGQRQRIAIARAFLKNAKILILDEATSQLDSMTEKAIQESLWKLMEGRTTLVIAHRLSTLLHMDRLLVFHGGKVVEQGSHQALVKKGGLYQTMWNAQVGGFLGDAVGPNLDG